MPRKRKINKHLPPRVYFKHGAYYFVDLKNKWHRLGKTFEEAMARWTKMISCNTNIYTMNQLFDRYMMEVAPVKARKTYKGNIQQVAPLRVWFGEMSPEDVTPVDVYKYRDKRGAKAKVAANREKALLSHVFNKAIEWGVVKDNPCRNVKRLPEKSRERYVEDWEYLAIKNIAPELIKNLMDFAWLTGQRIGDILAIKLTDIKDDVITIKQSKTQKTVPIGVSDELRELIKRIKKMPRSEIYSTTLFCNNKGGPLTYDGFSTVWCKTMKKALDEGLIESRFTFHDLRAKTTSDAKDLNHASALLGHADTRITERVYNRKPKKVMPLR